MSELEANLDRLADLLAGKGMGPYFASPLLTPEPKWLPDPWLANLGSVRKMLFRFADYAELSSLGIEVGLFTHERAPQWLPRTLAAPSHETGSAGLFLGIHENVAYFGIEKMALSDPVELVGILAHEMAHAWRHVMGVSVTDRQLEEELTDLTSIVLGWGILTSNAAYQYQSSGEQRGISARTRWSHKRAGYLSADVMAALLAVQRVSRAEDLRHVRRQLGATQADAFDEAVEWLETIDLETRLRLPPSEDRPLPAIEHARDMEIPLSRAGAELHELVTHLVRELGENGGIAESLIPFPVEAMEEIRARLVTWGRANHRGGWWRRLLLVSDPERPLNVVVLEAGDAEVRTSRVVGLISDRACARKRALEQALGGVLDAASPHIGVLLPEAPGCVFVDAPATLGASEVERLFRRGMTFFAPAQVSAETAWLESFKTNVRARVKEESKGVPLPVARKPARDPAREWWHWASNPSQARTEWQLIGEQVR